MVSKLRDSDKTIEQASIRVRSLVFRSLGSANDHRQKSKQLKFLILAYIVVLGICLLLPVNGLQGAEKSDEAVLDNIDAKQAMAIANQWKWTRKEVTSYVNPRGVIFVFPDKKVKGIPLPADKMLVAVAPYIRRTHR